MSDEIGSMVKRADLQDEANRRVYHSPRVEQEYHSWELTRCEALALLKYQPAFAGRDVLDLGVGTGRTAIYLAALARRYEAIDYSPVMVQRTRANLPDVSVRLGDLRDLSAFDDTSFDMVFALNNVLDAVSHEDRAHSLAEAHRVLRGGGLLMFSSHNRLYRHAQRGPRLNWSRNPVNQVMLFISWVRRIANNWRNRHSHRFEADYALLSDLGHDYACLHYYIDQTVQRQRLEAHGFDTLEVLDPLGRSVAAEDPSSASPWLMYVAERKVTNVDTKEDNDAARQQRAH